MTSPHELSLDAVLEQELQEWHDDQDLRKANKVLSEFYTWSKRNRDAMSWLYRHTKRLAQYQRHCSIATVFGKLRDESDIRIEGYDASLKVPNSFSPLVARILVKSIEGADKVFKLHSSYFNLLEDDQIPHYDRDGNLVWTVVPDVT